MGKFWTLVGHFFHWWGTCCQLKMPRDVIRKMRSLIYITLLTSENQTLNFMLYHLTKCNRIKQAYEVLCAKWTRKIWCKIFLHYTDIVIFVLGILIRITVNSVVYTSLYMYVVRWLLYRTRNVSAVDRMPPPVKVKVKLGYIIVRSKA